jgi:hypothetical protein
MLADAVVARALGLAPVVDASAVAVPPAARAAVTAAAAAIILVRLRIAVLRWVGDLHPWDQA